MRRIKDEGGKDLVTDDDIKDRWKNYYYTLFNDRDETLNYELDDLENNERNINYTFYRRIRVREVKEALRRMTSGKAIGPDGIPIEVWKCLGEKSVLWFTKLFN